MVFNDCGVVVVRKNFSICRVVHRAPKQWENYGQTSTVCVFGFQIESDLHLISHSLGVI